MKVRLIDTPGLEYVRAEDAEDEEKEKARAKDILLRSRGRIDRLKDPLFASECHRAILLPSKLMCMQVTHIVSRADTQDLMLAYSLPAFLKGEPTSFLAGMARVSGLIKKVCFLEYDPGTR
jgi:nuclear GTP-binding protein